MGAMVEHGTLHHRFSGTHRGEPEPLTLGDRNGVPLDQTGGIRWRWKVGDPSFVFTVEEMALQARR
jgi:hypothetical protein